MDVRKKKNLLKEFGAIFSERKAEDEIRISESELKGYLSSDRVLMVVPLVQEFKTLLLDNYDVSEHNVPSLSYVDGEQGASKFSTEYLKIILSLCKEYEVFKIECKKDYPLRITTKDFIIILAPRVDGD